MIWSNPSIIEVNILWCTTLWATFQNICPILGYFDFPHEWNCGNSSSNTTSHWGYTWPVAGLRTRATGPEWNFFVAKIYACAWVRLPHWWFRYIGFAIFHPRHKLDSHMCVDSYEKCILLCLQTSPWG